MEDIIYTLLVIGWIVFGVVKASSKKKKTSSNKGSTESVGSRNTQKEESLPINELLSNSFSPQMIKEDEIEHPYTEKFDIITPEKEEKVVKFEAHEKLDSYSGSDHVTSVFAQESTHAAFAINKDESVDNQSTDDEENSNSEEFNLRQAIIHQVILERPY